MRNYAKINGIITAGGSAPNIIPDHTNNFIDDKKTNNLFSRNNVNVSKKLKMFLTNGEKTWYK